MSIYIFYNIIYTVSLWRYSNECRERERERERDK